jgi:DNA-binding LytR/AlgR family response regulator
MEWRPSRKPQTRTLTLSFLDIGMPVPNGIDAANNIREVTPESKIIFVSKTVTRSWKLLLLPQGGSICDRGKRCH